MRDDLYGPLLGHCAHLAKEQMRARMERYDVTPTQTHVLLYLHENGATTQTALAEQMRVKAPTANGILDRMEEKGLVVRTMDGRDARRKLIRLTEKGEGLVEQLRRQFLLAENAILSGFDETERRQLKVFLQRIIKNLEVEAVC